MRIEKFEDIIAWQKAQEMTLLIYENMKSCRDFSFRNQVERASVSVMNNIAEGFERRTNRELINFFYIAKGSCGEVRSMLYLGVSLKYISKNQFEILYALSVRTSKLLSGFIKTL